ncbi:hypothetical protein H6G80_16700 [Nostoc sp. FACHB-87]|uniref:hypothetical protein n=1 Tax=Nostocales TaxID=1161 RepID=UPI001689B05E|nr:MULTISPECIES: hypothetical protein [Nostocales]MBD2301645.1 hypothetical protein [Nostoc sp. FACHB-190]MBD2455716.1 hypothetical protein [Nostoc sp. FACHB-87]MBD2477347.1 hypothetical protein [Anabaena sp. FACHB-83]MBD2490743.1 hypothetical protein [Aulosira sp. FACHB-615]
MITVSLNAVATAIANITYLFIFTYFGFFSSFYLTSKQQNSIAAIFANCDREKEIETPR